MTSLQSVVISLVSITTFVLVLLAIRYLWRASEKRKDDALTREMERAQAQDRAEQDAREAQRKAQLRIYDPSKERFKLAPLATYTKAWYRFGVDGFREVKLRTRGNGCYRHGYWGLSEAKPGVRHDDLEGCAFEGIEWIEIDIPAAYIMAAGFSTVDSDEEQVMLATGAFNRINAVVSGGKCPACGEPI